MVIDVFNQYLEFRDQFRCSWVVIIIEESIQEMSLIQEYLTCYHALTNPKNSKQANRRLIEIESSPESWSIAQTLIKDASPENRIHGCQLLSQKLNYPLPEGVAPNTIADFLYSQPQKSKLHWLCIAKSLLHMNSQTPVQLQMLSTDIQRLSLLREIPSAIIQTHTKQAKDVANILNQYMESSKQLFIRIFHSQIEFVIDVLEGFLDNGARLNCVELLQQLLEHDILDVGVLLEMIFKHETYPTLTQQIIAFLSKIEDNEDSFHVHLSFYQNNYTHFSNEQFQHMISYILRNLEKRQQADFAETYYFWQDLMSNYQKNALNPQKSVIFQNAIVTLWRLICNKCILTELPNHKNVLESSLSLCLDEPEQIDLQQPADCNRDALRFRDHAGDFMSICITTFGENSNFVYQMNLTLEILAKSSLLQLELAIYIISAICQIMPKATQSSKNAVMAILKREQELNEYLCGRVIDLIAKLACLFAASPDILGPCLSFLMKCLRFETLSPLASESCCELLEEAQVQESFLLSEDLEQFLGLLYELYFGQTLSERATHNLAKAMAIYIFKFKNTAIHYAQYLQNYCARIERMDLTDRAKFVEAAIAAQFWINVHDEQKHRPAFQQFLRLQSNFLLENIFNAPGKRELTAAINLLNLALKTNAISNVEIWTHLINEVENRYLIVDKPLPIIISPLVNLGKAALSLNREEIMRKVVDLLAYWASFAIDLLGNITRPKIEFNISNAVVHLHLTILQIYYSKQELLRESKYIPDNLLIFICSCFEQAEIWEYELYKNSLAYLTLAIKLGSPPQKILSVLFRNYRKFADALWTSVEPLLFSSYKAAGSEPILKALQQAKSILDSKNPLTAILVQSLSKSEGKAIKNILLCLS